MLKKLRQHGPGLARNDAVIAAGKRLRPDDELIDINPAVNCSRVKYLFGRPYPVQFRNQGAIDAWTWALETTEVWRCWQDPSTHCRQIRTDILRQFDHARPERPLSGAVAEMLAEDLQRLAVEFSVNLKNHLQKGTVIEATPALETLLTHSDVDLSLPMSMVAPPYRAQYLRFGETAMRYLKVPFAQAADHFFDGVFCFLTPPAEPCAAGEPRWTLELIFASKRQDLYRGHVPLLGETDRGSITVGEWLTRVLDAVKEQREGEFHRPVHAAVSYVAKVFLYMSLKRARVTEHRDHDAVLRRATGLGERKRAKILQRSASLYDGITVGPESLPLSAPACASSGSVTPHWRRGHSGCSPSASATSSVSSSLSRQCWCTRSSCRARRPRQNPTGPAPAQPLRLDPCLLSVPGAGRVPTGAA